MTALNAETVRTLTHLAVPSYDRSQASVGIVHFGLGNFHRSHQAMYVDRLMNSGVDLDWGICGVGLLPQDAAMRDVMSAQNGLYTLVLRHPDGALEPRVIGSVLEYLFAAGDPEAVFSRLVDPAVRIVSLTVTEGGYLKRPADGAFAAEHPDVVHDVHNLDRPRTAFAYIVEALRRRRAAGVAPFTVLSCDNLQGNGDCTRQTVTAFAGLVDPDLEAWIKQEVAFPNAMVDRITPVTTDADREVLRTEFGLDDQWPVPAEPFTQWIVEDHFPTGRPSLEAVDVQVVEDVRPYELMKLRLLNASHQALAWFGGLFGDVLVDEAMRRPELREYLLQYMRREAVPTLGPVPGVDLDEYVDTLVERFSNPWMRDTVRRLGTDGTIRMATFVLPAVQDNLAAGRPVRLGAGMVAAWARYWELVAAGRLPAAQVPDDPSAADLLAAAARQTAHPLAFLQNRRIFGDLPDSTVFIEAFAGWREILVRGGPEQCLRALLPAGAQEG